MSTMKKILTVSVIAMAAVSAANATIVSSSMLEDQLSGYVPTTTTVNSKALSGNISLGAGDVGAVPTSRTVNSKALSSDVTLAGSDIAVTGYSKPNATSAIAATDTVNAALGKLEKALDGKQGSGSYVPTTTTVNGKALSGNISLTASDVGAVASNNAITASGTTNKIVQYDAKGLVVAGTTAGSLATKSEVGSAEITDGSIVNADISSSAAIAQSKISGLTDALAAKQTTANMVTDTTGDDYEDAKASTDLYPSMATADQMIKDVTGKLGVSGKQDRSSSNYSMGNQSGGWTAMTTAQQNALNSGVTSSNWVSTSRTVNSKALSSDVTLAGSDIAVTGYSKPSSTSAIAATDTVNAAIGKLEKALDGKQASGSYVPTTRTVNSKALSSDISLTASDVGAVPTSRTVNSKALSSNVTLAGSDIAVTGYSKAETASAIAATDTVNAALGKLEKALDGKQASGSYVAANSAITGATKAKITYDSKGLVTGGADLAASDIPSLASSKVTAMTGYAKADSAAAIATTDSLNTAIGKLEKALDGKQASGSYVPTSTTVNGKALSGNISLGAGDVGAVAANSAITASGTTNKIVQYDAKGLVVAGTTAGSLATKSAVGSSEITDGSIVNADINASAAIASTKIADLAKVTSAVAGNTDGQYVLTAKVTNGVASFQWEDIGGR